jgi:hypothetical protein
MSSPQRLVDIKTGRISEVGDVGLMDWWIDGKLADDVSNNPSLHLSITPVIHLSNDPLIH